MKAAALVLWRSSMLRCLWRPPYTRSGWQSWIRPMGTSLNLTEKLMGFCRTSMHVLNVSPQISRDALINDTIHTKPMPYNGISTGDFIWDLVLVIKKYTQGQQLDTQAKDIKTQLEAANQELLDLLFSLAAKIGEKIKSTVVEVEESSTA